MNRPLFYRLSDTSDPEERLEDAALWKAMHDHYGDGIRLLRDRETVPEGGLMFGRTRNAETEAAYAAPSHCPYWEDPAFIRGISRDFHLADLEEAEALVAALHAAGKDAFLKAMRQKCMTTLVPRGQRIHEAIGDMVYSFIDRPTCLMVQEAVPMRMERRFVIMGRAIATQSAVAHHLTPLAREALHALGAPPEHWHFETPKSRVPFRDDAALEQMIDLASRTAREMRAEHMIIDVAMVGGRAELIEFNPCQPGHFGLYACDPNRIAAGSQAMMSDGLRQEIGPDGARPTDADPVPALPARAPDEDWLDLGETI